MDYRKLIIIGLLLICFSNVFAQTSFKEQATMTPDNTFYFLDRGLEFFEGLRYQFNAEDRMQWNFILAEERLGEAELMAEKGFDVNGLMNEYNNNIQMALDNNNVQTQERFRQRLEVHAMVLEQVKKSVPEQVMVIIQNSINKNYLIGKGGLR